MNFLLDTNVISEPRRKRPDRHVVSWLRRTEFRSLHISVLTMGELMQGVVRLARRDAAQATALGRWLDEVRANYADRIIPIDIEIAQAWGRLNASRPLPPIDGFLVATALVRGMTFVTRDTQSIADTGVVTVDPWAG